MTGSVKQRSKKAGNFIHNDKSVASCKLVRDKAQTEFKNRQFARFMGEYCVNAMCYIAQIRTFFPVVVVTYGL